MGQQKQKYLDHLVEKQGEEPMKTNRKKEKQEILFNQTEAKFIVMSLSRFMNEDWNNLGLFNYYPIVTIFKKIKEKFKDIDDLDKEDIEVLEDLENFYK